MPFYRGWSLLNEVLLVFRKILKDLSNFESIFQKVNFGFTLLSPKKKVGKAPNCYVGISPKGKNVKFLLVTLHVGTSPKFCVKLEYLRKGKNILLMSLTLHVGTSPNIDMTLLT